MHFCPISKQAPVVLMTSRMGSIGDNTSGSSYGYRMSKVALSMAGKSWLTTSNRVELPWRFASRFGANPHDELTSGGITPEESVKGLLARIDELTLENTDFGTRMVRCCLGNITPNRQELH